MRILAVNFNVIMTPCIRLYDSLVDIKENPTILWDSFKNELEIDNHISYDASILELIANFLRDILNRDKIPLVCPTSTEDYIRFINGWLPADDTKLDIVNLDYTSGLIPTNSPEFQEVSDFDKYNSRNWMTYLFSKDMVNSYEWYRCVNSKIIPPEDVNFEYKQSPLKSVMSIISNTDKFDYVLFCFDEHWVPYKYKHLYDLIVSLLPVYSSTIVDMGNGVAFAAKVLNEIGDLCHNTAYEPEDHAPECICGCGYGCAEAYIESSEEPIESEPAKEE